VNLSNLHNPLRPYAGLKIILVNGVVCHMLVSVCWLGRNLKPENLGLSRDTICIWISPQKVNSSLGQCCSWVNISISQVYFLRIDMQFYWHYVGTKYIDFRCTTYMRICFISTRNLKIKAEISLVLSLISGMPQKSLKSCITIILILTQHNISWIVSIHVIN
jgi:hypothetical protein